MAIRAWCGRAAHGGRSICRRRARDDLGGLLPGLFRAGPCFRARERPPPGHDARPVDGRFSGSYSRAPHPGRGGGRRDPGWQGRRRACETRVEHAACGEVHRVLGQRQRRLSIDHAVPQARRCGPGGGQESKGARAAVGRAGGRGRGAGRGGDRLPASQRVDTRPRGYLRRLDSGRAPAGICLRGGPYQHGPAAGGGKRADPLSGIARGGTGDLEGSSRCCA